MRGGNGRRREDWLAGGHREQYYDPVVARIWEDTKISETSIGAVYEEVIPG